MSVRGLPKFTFVERRLRPIGATNRCAVYPQPRRRGKARSRAELAAGGALDEPGRFLTLWRGVHYCAPLLQALESGLGGSPEGNARAPARGETMAGQASD